MPDFLRRVRVEERRPLTKATHPAAAKPTSTAEARRGAVAETAKKVARPLAIGAAVAGSAVAVGYAVHEGGSAVAQAREATRARIEVAQTPIDTNGDGRPDAYANVPYVLGPDGAFSSFGAAPNFTQAPKPSGTQDFAEAAKTVGLVVAGIVVVGALAYVVTRPGVVKGISKAVGA